MNFYEKYKTFIHPGLFVITFITATISGMEWVTGSMGPFEISEFKLALPYSFSILFILSIHEFGHYFAARYHGVKTTLPFYIPFPPLPGFLNFGTMGAIIKTQSRVPDNRAMFDIGIAGPLAGFVACIIVLAYGFSNLPGQEYILAIHPDFFSPEYGSDSLYLEFGNNLIFIFFREIFTSPGQFIPPMSEIYHYPYLCTGWFGLFITSMNLIPVGQLDGGHISFGLFGHRLHERIAFICFILLLALGAFGFVDMFLGMHYNIGWPGWLFWAFILKVVIKLKHPPVLKFSTLSNGRKLLGILSFLILILSFSQAPFIVNML